MTVLPSVTSHASVDGPSLPSSSTLEAAACKYNYPRAISCLSHTNFSAAEWRSISTGTLKRIMISYSCLLGPLLGAFPRLFNTLSHVPSPRGLWIHALTGSLTVGYILISHLQVVPHIHSHSPLIVAYPSLNLDFTIGKLAVLLGEQHNQARILSIRPEFR